MEFLIFSDTHGNRRGIEEVVARQIRPIDGIFFLGDGVMDLTRAALPPEVSVFAVRGNCDYPGEGAPPLESVSALCGHTILLTHGHLYGVKSGVGRLVSAGVERGADILLFGHTHKPVEEIFPVGSEILGMPLSRPLYLFNPGSLQKGSFGVLTLTKDAVLFSHGNLSE